VQAADELLGRPGGRRLAHFLALGLVVGRHLTGSVLRRRYARHNIWA
jgi:hypothetical protein